MFCGRAWPEEIFLYFHSAKRFAFLRNVVLYAYIGYFN